MRATIFTDILDQTVIEVGGRKDEVIKNLRAQSGICREKDTNGNALVFSCTRKGALKVDGNTGKRTSASERTYYVTGQVCEESGRTVIKLYSVHSKSTKLFKYAQIALVAMAVAVYTAILAFVIKAIRTRDIIFLLFACAMCVFFVFSSRKEETNKDEDLSIMKKEVISRIEALKRWDE